jgi:hypothetical protein
MAVINSIDQLLEILPCIILFQPPTRSLCQELSQIECMLIAESFIQILMKRWTTHNFVEKFTTSDELHHYVNLCLAGHHLHKRGDIAMKWTVT